MKLILVPTLLGNPHEQGSIGNTKGGMRFAFPPYALVRGAHPTLTLNFELCKEVLWQ